MIERLIFVGLLLALDAIVTPQTAGSPDAQPAGIARLVEALEAEAGGDIQAAESICRGILAAQPNDDAAYEALLRICAQRKLQADSDALAATIEALPATFRTYETSRFIVLSDTDPTWSREQANRLERAHQQFQRFCRRLDLRPLPLKHKLVCVLFDNRDAYQAFAREHDEVVSAWIAGYYAPAADRIVFYNIKSNPSVAQANEQLAEMQAKIDEVRRGALDARRWGRGEEAESLNHLHHQYRDHVQRERDRVDEFTQRVSVSTTTHEAIHMLLFHCGVQTPRVQYPLWICEGLATNFETDDASRNFGPDCEHAPRRERFDELLAGDRLLPLEELVPLVEIPAEDADEFAAIVYHQSYALVHWMSRFRKPEMAAYLNLMRAESTGRLSPLRHRELFVKAFGEIESLERSWLRHESDRLASASRLAEARVP